MVCCICRKNLTAPDDLFCPHCSESQEERERICMGDADGREGHERTVLPETWKGCPVCWRFFGAQPNMKSQCPAPKCKYQYDDDFDWCPRCGIRLSSEVLPNHQRADPVASTPREEITQASHYDEGYNDEDVGASDYEDSGKIRQKGKPSYEIPERDASPDWLESQEGTVTANR